jgi:hypothetical protein
MKLISEDTLHRLATTRTELDYSILLMRHGGGVIQSPQALHRRCSFINSLH